MGTLSVENPTLRDVAQRMDPDGNIANIVELMSQDNEILEDMTVIECNNGSAHRHTIRTGLPTVAWRRLNYGVKPSKSRTAQVMDTCGMLEAFSQVDQKLVDMNKNPAAFRMSEDSAFLESMNQEMAKTLFYGNEKDNPDAFTGMSIRCSDPAAENGYNIIDAGGASTDNTSIWLVVWGPQTCFGLYPQGSKAGLSQTDLGVETVEDAEGGLFRAYRTHFQWDLGFTVRDWRYIGRIGSIDVSDLGTLANTKNLVTWMTQLSERVKVNGKGRAVFYCNRTIMEKLRLGILEKIANNLNWEDVSGKRVAMFDGIPIRRCDQILNTEAPI